MISHRKKNPHFIADCGRVPAAWFPWQQQHHSKCVCNWRTCLTKIGSDKKICTY